MKENECNVFDEMAKVFEEKAKQNSEMELKRINEIKEKLECDLNITEDEMRDMIRTFRKSPKSYAIRLERFREIKNTLVGLMLAKVPYTKDNMMKCGISLYEILYLDFYGAISLRGDGSYWVYWHENKYRPDRTLDKMEKDLQYWTPNTLETQLGAVYSKWLSHVTFEDYIEDSIKVIEKFSKSIQRKWGGISEEDSFSVKNDSYSIEDWF